MKRLIFLMSMLLCLTITQAENKEEDTQAFLLQSLRAGHVKIGMSKDELYTLFGEKSTRFVDLNIEGHYCPAIEIYQHDTETEKPSLVAEITQDENWTVWRIRVYDTRYKTEQDIGVDSTIGDIIKVYDVKWQSCGEHVLCARVDDIQMSFVIDFFPGNWFIEKNPESIPDSTIVKSIHIEKQ
ncbi:MAG: hypothetical protein JXB48_13830 [Candidatus Latescibacteria bacterium]|nr:hypothetical protein [Candidatus Latescibacterota bacterium]